VSAEQLVTSAKELTPDTWCVSGCQPVSASLGEGRRWEFWANGLERNICPNSLNQFNSFGQYFGILRRGPRGQTGGCPPLGQLRGVGGLPPPGPARPHAPVGCPPFLGDWGVWGVCLPPGRSSADRLPDR
jgi:hypothetical protein